MSAMRNPHGNVTHHFRTKLKAYKMKTSNPLNLVLFFKKKKNVYSSEISPYYNLYL